MKRINFTIFMVSFTLILCAQRVDIDKFKFKVQTANYPVFDIPLEQRTFDVKYEGDANFEEVVDNISLKNFLRDEENPNFVFNVNITKFEPSGYSSKSRVDKKKNKDGKVISSKTYYYVEYKNTGRGMLRINGPEFEKWEYKTPKQLEKEAKKLAEEEAKAKKAEMEAQKEKDDNPFLSNVETEVEEDEVEDNSDSPLFKINLSTS